MTQQCPSCGKDNMPGVAYCAHCGEPIGRYEKLIQQVRDIEEIPPRYGALRFVTGLMAAIGWVVIIGWALIEMLMYTAILRVIQSFVQIDTAPLFNIFSSLLMVLTWLPGLLIGLSIIAFGQMIHVLIDIRNEVYVTRRYTRRFGLYMARSVREETE